MPVYDYKCTEHGLFHELGTMETSGEPKACPQCGKLSARVIMIAPQVLQMAPERRAAMEKNEQARHAPILSSVDSRAEAADRAAHAHKHGHKGHSCGCASEHRSQDNALKQQVIFLSIKLSAQLTNFFLRSRQLLAHLTVTLLELVDLTITSF